MDRTAAAARTPHGEENVNRLRVPEYGVASIRIVAGDKSSKCHRPPQSPDPQPEDKGTDDFHFVPEKEELTIEYEVFDPYGTVEEAKLELFTRFDEAALWKLDLKALGADWWAHGKHKVKWDGRVVAPTAAQKATPKDDAFEHDLTAIDVEKSADKFPDGYVTLEYTPYKLKLTLDSGAQAVTGNPATGWTYFHLLLKKIEFELGPEETVPAATVDDWEHKRDKMVRKYVESGGGVPEAGKERRVVLLSNLYKTALGQMDDDTFFTMYQTAFGDGPRLPVIAKIRMSDSQDAEVKLDESDKGAVALGNAKFLWDWEDAAEKVDTQQTAAKPKAFIKDAINYYKNGTDAARAGSDHTYPKGDNCHVDRGGKRGPAAKAVFQEEAGYAAKDTLDEGKFPFEVKACKERKWAALSKGWSSGKLKGKTGAVFRPSRMGGDSYTLVVYLAYDKSAKDKLVLDAKDEPLKAPAAIQQKTGTFVTWREIHIARYVRKTGTLAQFLPGNLGAINAHFKMAYVDLKDKLGAHGNYVLADHRLSNGTKPDYNVLLRARLTHAWFTSGVAVDAAADHSSVDSMIFVRPYRDFVYLVHQALAGAAGNADLAGLGTDLGTNWNSAAEQLGTTNVAAWGATPKETRLKATRTWLRNNGVETAGKYAVALDNIGFGIGEPFAGDLKLITGGKHGASAGAPHGITTLEFKYTNTELRDLIAAGQGLRYWYGAAIDPPDADKRRCVIMFWLAGVSLFSHEAGHHVFLPHAKYPTASPPGGNKPARHDDTDSGCLMTYSNARPAFCGLCQLRLRGWSGDKLDKISATNKKP